MAGPAVEEVPSKACPCLEDPYGGTLKKVEEEEEEVVEETESEVQEDQWEKPPWKGSWATWCRRQRQNRAKRRDPKVAARLASERRDREFRQRARCLDEALGKGPVPAELQQRQPCCKKRSRCPPPPPPPGPGAVKWWPPPPPPPAGPQQQQQQQQQQLQQYQHL